MRGTVRVSTTKLIQTANQFQGHGNQIKSITQQMTNTVNSLSRCVWTGEAANAYRNKFAALQDDINRMVKMIDEHVSDLNEMAKQYESAEQTSISLSASLSDNVII